MPKTDIPRSTSNENILEELSVVAAAACWGAVPEGVEVMVVGFDVFLRVALLNVGIKNVTHPKKNYPGLYSGYKKVANYPNDFFG